MEFAVFFVLPFDEDTPPKISDEALKHLMAVKAAAEDQCLDAYRKLVPDKGRQDHRVWAQSRIDTETRIIGVSLRLPIEKGAERHLVPAVVHDDFLYWDFDELVDDMKAMYEAVGQVAAEHGAKPHAAYSDVKYRY